MAAVILPAHQVVEAIPAILPAILLVILLVARLVEDIVAEAGFRGDGSFSLEFRVRS